MLPKPKTLPEPPKQEPGAPSPLSPQHSHEPPRPCQGAGEFQAGRKAFTETPSHSFPPRDAISSDTLPRRDLHGKFHGRLPSLLCSLMPAVGLCSHTTLAQELVAWVPHALAVPSQEGLIAMPGSRSCWQQFRAPRPSSHAGQMGADLCDGSLLDTFSTEQGNLGGFQIPLQCLHFR